MTIITALLIMLSYTCKPEKALSETTSQEVQKIILQPQDTLTCDLNFLTGRFDPAKHDSFVKIPAIYGNREGMYLQKEVFEAFLLMYDAAKKDNIHLKIVSATRNFEAQKSIWEAKWNNLLKDDKIKTRDDKDILTAKNILEYSSMPGTSRHHWGTDIDLNALNNEWFEKGEGKLLYDWMIINGPSFGFHLVYSEKGQVRPTGYNEEKWHYTYKPLSKKYTALVRENLKDTDIKGFEGAHTAVQLNIVNQYVLGIHPDCF
jgi:D-alanyl-D-alanine carboxypeptidase